MNLYKALGSGSGMPGAPANSSAPSQGAGAPSMPAPDLYMALAQNEPQLDPSPPPTPENIGIDPAEAAKRLRGFKGLNG